MAATGRQGAPAPADAFSTDARSGTYKTIKTPYTPTDKTDETPPAERQRWDVIYNPHYMIEVRDYTTEDGRVPIKEWLGALADRTARARIVARIGRMSAGNFGDCKPLDAGVWELRIDHGPGYRVYYAKTGKTVVLLLIGGDKRRQQADIKTAQSCLQDWRRRNAP